MSDDRISWAFQSILKEKKKQKYALVKQLENLDAEIADMEKSVVRVAMLAVKQDFREDIKKLKELQDEDIQKRLNCGEGLQGKNKKRLEQGIKMPECIQDDWITDELEENNEYYKKQLELIVPKNQ